jgi:hypothetical protein
MAELLQEYEQKPTGRPTFLTVLCILTFVGSGFGLINGVYQYLTAEKAATELAIQKKESAEQIRKSGKSDAGTRFAGRMVASVTDLSASDLRKGGLLAILAAVICITGAFMMWKLRKGGYYVYILGIILGIISPFIVFGSSNLAAVLGSTMVGFIGIVFIILYGVNVKHMR